MTPRGNWQALCMGTPPGQEENGVSDLFGAMIRDKIGVGAGAFNARPTGKKKGNAGAPNGEGLFRSEEMVRRSEEHTSELQSLMRISYAVFCLKKKKTKHLESIKLNQHK